MRNRHVERSLVRAFVAFTLSIALLASALAPLPRDAMGEPALPGPAFEQVGLYRLEVALLVFYGGLLLVTPAFSGLIRGRLPIEISARGAKFAEGAARSGELGEAKLEELEKTTSALKERLAAVNVEVGRLKDVSRGDSSQPEVDSEL